MDIKLLHAKLDGRLKHAEPIDLQTRKAELDAREERLREKENALAREGGIHSSLFLSIIDSSFDFLIAHLSQRPLQK